MSALFVAAAAVATAIRLMEEMYRPLDGLIVIPLEPIRQGNFYVAERFAQRVRCFGPNGTKKGTFIDHLPDIPEFLIHVADRG